MKRISWLFAKLQIIVEGRVVYFHFTRFFTRLKLLTKENVK